MKTHAFLLITALTGTVLAQGPLIPLPGPNPSVGPVDALDGIGAPQGTMKTLHQVEPRTAISPGAPGVTANPNGGFTITAPGSYYLTANFEVASGNGIIVSASHVTLDLMGFTITRTGGPADFGAGVALGEGTTGITVKNGGIVGGTTRTGAAAPFTYSPAGFHHGVAELFVDNYATSTAPVLVDLVISACAGNGIRVPGSVSRCTVTNCANNGIEGSSVDHSTARENGGSGIAAGMVLNCVGSFNNGSGIDGWMSATSCVAHGNAGSGVSGGAVAHCSVFSNGGGINATTALNCSAFGNKAYGISCKSATNCRVKDTVVGTDPGAVGNGIIASTVTNCHSEGNAGVGILATEGTVTGCTADDNGAAGIKADKGSVNQSQASDNTLEGIKADRGSVSNCAATRNGLGGIASFGGSATGCTSSFNIFEGIWVPFGVVTGCKATENGTWGILANSGSISHCNATTNNTSAGAFGGIFCEDAVVSFCFSKFNTGSQYATGSGATLNSNR